MSDLFNRSIVKLELPQVLQELSFCAGSGEGKAACLELTPVSDLEDVQSRLDETTQASALCDRNGYPAFRDLHDITQELIRAEMGGCLQPAELLRIAGVLRCARNLKAYGDTDEQYPALFPYFVVLTVNKHLEDNIFNAILSEEDIADHASPALADIRRQMRVQSAKIKDSLQKIISSSTSAKYLQEQIITIRQGRYVVPVKSEHKNNIPGLVHDVSATGSTYFIEPVSAVSANNALRELELEEQ